jgi:MarR family transcriptional regulator, organic hydroperoxide resistance regulator
MPDSFVSLTGRPVVKPPASVRKERSPNVTDPSIAGAIFGSGAGGLVQSKLRDAEPHHNLGGSALTDLNRDHAAKLSDVLCFDLYAAARAVTRAYGPHLAALGLTYPQYLVMSKLWQHAPRTVKELGQQLDLDSGTLSPLLKRLEATGLVTRRRRVDDERTVEIAPTTKGRVLAREAGRVANAMATELGITLQDAKRLRGLLGQLITSVNRHEPVEPRE